MSKNYIPSNDARFWDWVQNLYSEATKGFTKWKIAAPELFLEAPMADFEIKLAKMSDPNRGRIDTLEKNVSRKALEKVCREYVQGFLARNPLVTDVDRQRLGITVYDTIPTVVPPPAIPAEGDLYFPANGMVEVRNIRAVGETADRRADYGVRIYYGILGTSDETDRFRISAPPKTGDDLPHSVFTRLKKHRFNFVGDSGREAFFCVRFENSKGQAGPWGKILSAFIP